MRRTTKKIRVGVLGAGRGQTFAALYDRHPNAETVAMCDARRGRLAAAAKSLGITGMKTYTDLKKFLQHPMEAVVVCSDAPRHAEHAVICLEAGFHVQSEVPMDYTYEGCYAIVEAVERTGLKYMMAENYQYVPLWPRLRRWIKQGKFGEVVYCEGEYVHDCRVLHWVDDAGNVWTYDQARKHPEAIRSWRSGVHPINYITHSLGPLLYALDDRCLSVSCLSTGPRTEPRDGNPDAEVAIMKTTRGTVIKNLCAHSIAHPGHVWFTLMGTKGSIETLRGSADQPVVYFEGEGEAHRWRRVAWEEISEPVSEEAKQAGHGGGDYFLAEGFLRAILEDGDTPISAYRAADYTLPGIMAARSAENGGIALPVPDLRPETRKQFRVRPPSLALLEGAKEPRHPAKPIPRAR